MPREDPSEPLRAIQVEVLRYLVAHPEAKDTLEGMMNWWLPQGSARWRTANLISALEELVGRGWIATAGRPGPGRVYGLDIDRLDEIRRFLEG